MEISLDLGNIFSGVLLVEITNNCIPPIFIIGIKVIAITIIPIPPNHWSIARHNKIAFGVSFKLVIIVDPAVVIPDILSKNALVRLNSVLEKINGSEPNIAILNQDRAVRRKAWGKFSFLLWSRLDKKNNIPNIIVITPELTKPESTWS